MFTPQTSVACSICGNTPASYVDLYGYGNNQGEYLCNVCKTGALKFCHQSRLAGNLRYVETENRLLGVSAAVTL